MSIKRRWFRTIVFGLLAVIACSVFGFFVLAQFFHSPTGSAKLAGFVKYYLNNNNLGDLEYSEGRIDPLRGFHFRNLKLVYHTSDLQAEVTAPTLDLDFECSFLKRHLEVFGLTADQPRIVIRAMETAKPAPKKEPGSLDDLAKQIKNPSLTVKVDKVSITNLKIDFTSVTKQAVETKMLGEALDFSFNSELMPGHVVASGKVHSGKDLLVSTADSSSFVAKFDGNWDLELKEEKGSWLYLVRPTHFQVDVRDIKSIDQQTGASFLAKSGKFVSDLDANAISKELFKTDADSVRAINLACDLQINKIELWNSRQKPSSRVEIGQQRVVAKIKLEKEIVFDLAARTEGINNPPNFSRTVDLSLNSRGTLARDLKKLGAEVVLKLAGYDLGKINLSAESFAPEAGHVHIDGGLKLSKDLATFVKPLNSLRKSCDLDAQLKADAEIQNRDQGTLTFIASVPMLQVPGVDGGSTVDDEMRVKWNFKDSHHDLQNEIRFNNLNYGKWRVQTQLATQSATAGKGKTSVVEERSANAKYIPATFAKPIVIQHSFDLSAGSNRADFEVAIPSAAVYQKASLENTKFKIAVRSPDFSKADDVDLSGAVSQGAIHLDPKFATTPVPITGLSADVKATLRGGSVFNLEKLVFNLNNSMLVLNADAAGNIRTREIQANATVSGKFPANFPKLAGTSIRGEFALPARVSVVNGSEITVTGNLQLADMSVSQPEFGLSGISGRIPFAEKLIFDGKNLRFRELITQNPFERVDFERLRPLIQGTERLRIDHVSWQERRYGPLIGFFSIKQNMIFAHQFDLDLASGRVYGEFFFDAYPSNLQLGTLSRLSNLDLAEILPAKYLVKIPPGEKKVSGRSGFVLNLNRGTVDGRIDITEIGGSQLVSMINVLDPNYEDEKLNRIRSLLGVGYPTFVQMGLHEGYLDMDLGLSILGISKNENLRGIPISSLVSQVTSEIVKQTKKGPLK